MKTLLSLVVALSLISLGTSICAINANFNLYYLCPFSLKTFNAQSNGYNYTFALLDAIVPSCDTKGDYYAVGQGGVISDCGNVAQGSPTASLLDSSDASKGVVLTYPIATDVDSDGKNQKRYQLTVKLTCDQTQDNTDQTTFSVDGPFTFYDGAILSVLTDSSDVNNITITASTSHACPVVSFSNVVQFFANNKVLFLIIFIVIGLLITFFGLNLFHVVVFLLAVVVTCSLCFSLFVSFTSEMPKTWLLWVLFVIALLLGLVVGVVSIKFPKVGHFLIGAVLGFIGGSILFTAIISPIVSTGDGSAILIVVVILSMLVGGIAGIYLIESIMIIATSVIGSYITVRTLSFAIGGFPLETDIANGTAKFSAAVYGYIVGIALLAAAGIYFQFRMKQKHSEQAEAFNAKPAY